MNPQANAQAQLYLRTRVLTATPEQLQMMLYDGALRFGEQARVALEQKNYEQSYKSLTRLQKIVSELMCSMKPDVYPELCDKLVGLYKYVYKRLVYANMKRDSEALEEAMKLLKYQRDTWAMLMQQLSQQKAAAAANQLQMPAPDPRMEASISMSA